MHNFLVLLRAPSFFVPDELPQAGIRQRPVPGPPLPLILCAFLWASVAFGADQFLTPGSLAMARPRITLADSCLRLFNKRGSVSPRDWTVCGIKHLRFPPNTIPDYRFGLAFREHTTGTLILDNQDEYEDPLYLNQKEKDPNILLSQDAVWQPNLYTRRGTFHRYLNGRLISFGVESRLSVAADADEAFLEIDVSNRGAAPLTLTVIPDQRVAQNNRPDYIRQPLGGTLKPNQPPGAERTASFTFQTQEWQVAAASDLPIDGDAGWRLDVPANGHRAFRIGLAVNVVTAAEPPRQVTDLESRVARGQAATREYLGWAAGRLPHVQTASKALDEFYARSALTMLMCRLERPNYVATPFYDFGQLRGASVLWDLSFASSTIALLEPEALKGMVRAHLQSGIFKATYTNWKGDGSGWYAQSPFALLRIVNDYLARTGNTAWLDERTGSSSLYEQLCEIGQEVHKRYAQSDGLLDFGQSTSDMLEIRTSGYYHIVAATNGMASDFFHQLAGWGQARHDARAAEFERWSQQIAGGLQKQLWDDAAGWFINLFPDGSRHLVMSYHLFDLLESPSIRQDQRQRMVAHLKAGEFTGPFGLHSIAPSDRTHYDREDVDFGGGGQYIGMSTRIIESLYRLGERAEAWDLLKRCTRWTERFPYWPQTIYADELALQSHQVNWPVQLSGGGGVQAVVAGVFGIHPKPDGTLEFQPSCELDLGDAKLSGYRFRDNSYDVAMSSRGFTVWRDRKVVARGRPGGKVTLKGHLESSQR